MFLHPLFVSLGLFAFVCGFVVLLLLFSSVVAKEKARCPHNLVLSVSLLGGAVPQVRGVWCFVIVAPGVDVGGKRTDLAAKLVDCRLEVVNLGLQIGCCYCVGLCVLLCNLVDASLNCGIDTLFDAGV